MVEEYFGRPEASLAAFREPLVPHRRPRPHGRGRLVHYIDRLKDAIRRRGENISSWEVEQVVNDHEAVEESAVVGVPSELTEEEVIASSCSRKASELDTRGAARLLPGSAPALRRPRYVRFVGELPKNHAQRIQKQELRGEGVTSETWDREEHGYVVTR